LTLKRFAGNPGPLVAINEFIQPSDFTRRQR
jgi:hypothetical protein